MESPHPVKNTEPPLSPATSLRTEVLRYYTIIDTNRMKLNKPWNTLTTEVIVVATSELLAAYKELIMLDLEGGIQRQLELSMWYYCFKGPLQHFMRHDNAMYHHFIETGIGFYLGFIHDVGIHFDVPFVRNTQRGLHGTAPCSRRLVQNSPSKGAVYYILQNSLIRVGDLLRYRSSLVEALKMYDKAVYLCPRNGHPFHQMGSAQTLLDSSTVDGHLAAIYYYARAVSVSDPYVAAQHSLDGLLVKVKSLSPASKVEEFTHSFLVAVGNPQPNVVSSASPLLVTMLSPLVTNSSMSSVQLFRIIVVALWAWTRESSKFLLAVDSSSENIVLEIIAAIFNSLLIAANAHSDLTNFCALPHLKVLVDWLRVNSSLVNNPAFRTKLHTNTLCSFFNQLLVLENNVCGMRSREMERIILPEEKRLLGFLPFCRTYENLTCVMDETDTRITWVRIYRTLKCADSLSEARLGFIERHGPSGYFSEIPFESLCSVNRAPPGPGAAMKPSTHRNVAFQSIFNQLGSETFQFSTPLVAASASEAEPGLPVSSQTTNVNALVRSFDEDPSQLPLKSSNSSAYDDKAGHDPEGEDSFRSGYNSSAGIIGCRFTDTSPVFRNDGGALTPTTYLPFSRAEGVQPSEGDTTDFSSLFRSIWTPSQDDSNRTGADGWTA